MASRRNVRVAQSRKGRRPMSVETMLRKEKDGTLYKNTKLSSALEDARDTTTEAFNKVKKDNRYSKALEDIKSIKSSLKDSKNVEFPSAKTDIKTRWARLLERRGDLKEKYAGRYGKNSAGFDLQGKVEVQEIPVAIENRKGSVREGTNPDGSEWRTKFKTPYGYIEGTKGADGDEIDAYVGPNKNSPHVFVARQKKPDGKHDEDTVMLGYSSKGSARKDILRHYKDKSQVGEVVGPMPVEVLKAHLARAGGKKITKLGTSLPAKLRSRKGDAPTRMEDPYPPALAENRQENQQTKLVDSFQSAGGDDVGKVASPIKEVFRTSLKAQVKNKTHDNTKKAMLDELKALGALTPGQVEKLANEVTYTEAKDSLKRLGRLEESAPTAGEVARGGGVGAVVMPLSALAWRAVAGPKGRIPGPKGPQQIWSGTRPMLATAAQGAVLGGLLPAGRHQLETEVEKQRLKEYAGQRRRGTLRGRIRRTLGI